MPKRGKGKKGKKVTPNKTTPKVAAVAANAQTVENKTPVIGAATLALLSNHEAPHPDHLNSESVTRLLMDNQSESTASHLVNNHPPTQHLDQLLEVMKLWLDPMDTLNAAPTASYTSNPAGNAVFPWLKLLLKSCETQQITIFEKLETEGAWNHQTINLLVLGTIILHNLAELKRFVKDFAETKKQPTAEYQQAVRAFIKKWRKEISVKQQQFDDIYGRKDKDPAETLLANIATLDAIKHAFARFYTSANAAHDNAAMAEDYARRAYQDRALAKTEAAEAEADKHAAEIVAADAVKRAQTEADKVNALKQKFEAIKQKHQAEMGSITKQLNDLQQQSADNDKALEQAKKAAKNASAAVVQAENDVRKLFEEFTKTQTDLKNVNNELAHVKDERDSHAQEAADYWQQLQKKSKGLQQAMQKLTCARTQYQRMKGFKEALKQLNQRLIDQENNLRQQIMGSNQENADLNQYIQMLQGQLTRATVGSQHAFEWSRQLNVALAQRASWLENQVHCLQWQMQMNAGGYYGTYNANSSPVPDVSRGPNMFAPTGGGAASVNNSNTTTKTETAPNTARGGGPKP